MSSQRPALRPTVAGISALMSVLVASPLGAAVFEEFVVTAQKREQDIQDVSVSVSAFTGDQMRVLGVEDSFDIALFVPNVNISGNLAGQNTQFSIRGVTQNDFNDIIEAPVAVYLDEMPMTMSSTQLDPRMVDINRVESLPRPQGTLFGSSSQGGTLRLVTNKPDPNGFSGEICA